MKPKTIFLYAKMGHYTHQFFLNCTDVTYDGPVLSFTDGEGVRHMTSAPWEITQ